MSRSIIIWLLTALLLPVSALAQPKVVRLSTHNLCPYGCVNESGQFDGDAYRVVKYALNRMGIELKIEVLPWKRAQSMAWAGETDGFFAASRSLEREQRGHLSAVITEQKWNWYLLKENPLQPSSPTFKVEATVGSFIGSNMLIWLTNNHYNVVARPCDTEHLVDMLLAGRFDAMLANNLVMREIINRDHLEGRFNITTMSNKPLSVCFTNRFVEDNPGFLDRFDSFVREYRAAHP